MPDKKLTDSEIVKALECCQNDEDCQNCPLKEFYPYCDDVLSPATIDLINRLQADNERLRDKVKDFKKIRRAYQRFIHENMPYIQNSIDNLLKELGVE